MRDLPPSARPARFTSPAPVGTMAAVSNSETMPTGRLMKKHHRQEKLSVIHPPSVGPMAGAATMAKL